MQLIQEPLKKTENLSAGGRCGTGDGISHAAIRNMMCRTVTGWGAGVADAVSIKDNAACRDIVLSKYLTGNTIPAQGGKYFE